MRFGPLTVFVASFLSLGACGTSKNSASGGDAGRGDAVAIKLQALQYDRVSADDGDHTDWKGFKIGYSANVAVDVWWDEPNRVSATLSLVDQFGRELGSLKHTKAAAKERLGPIAVDAGTYFLKVEASSGQSVYTFRVTESAIQGGAGGSPDL